MHIATAGIEHKDSVNTLRLNTSVSFMDMGSSSISSRQAYSVADLLVNEGERNAITQNNNFNFNTDLFYGHRFGKSGRNITVRGQFSTSQDQSLGHSESFTWFTEGNAEEERQRNEQDNREMNIDLRLTYTEPLGNKQYLQGNYNISNLSSNSNLEVWDIINETSLFNREQSSRFSSGFLYQQAGLTYRLNRNQHNFSLGANFQNSSLTRRIEFPSDQLTQSFQNLLPHLSFNTRFNKLTRLNFDYLTSVREPRIDQLQPVISRFDPLHLYIGNPDLRPQYTHQGRLTINTSFKPSGMFLSGSVNFNYTTNPIITAVSINEDQVRTSQYVNVKENLNFAFYLNAGIPLPEYNSQFSFSPYLRQEQSYNLLNGVEGTISQQAMGGKFAYSYSYNDFLDFNLRTDRRVTRSDYELNENQNQVFRTSAYMADATINFLRDFYVMAEFNYSRFRNPGVNFDQAIPLFNFSLSRVFLKDQRGELKLSAYNVLNRNIGVSQIATPNYIEQSTQNALGNFYMLSFTYNLQPSN
jgi:hypothetical protein